MRVYSYFGGRHMRRQEHTPRARFIPLGICLSVLLALCAGFVMGTLCGTLPGNMPYAVGLAFVLLVAALVATNHTLASLKESTRLPAPVDEAVPDSPAKPLVPASPEPVAEPAQPDALEDEPEPVDADADVLEDDDGFAAEPESTVYLAQDDEELEAGGTLSPTTSTTASRLDYEAFAKKLTTTNDPIAELKLFVGGIRTREAGKGAEPSPYERYAARRLSEAGLFDREVKLPQLRIVRPKPSRMLYLRVTDKELSYLAKTRVLSLEAALNALRLSNDYFDDPNEHSVREHYQLIQRLTSSVTAQSPNLAEHVSVIDDDNPDSEWAVRLGISTAIESFQLPFRLTADYRTNVADGNVAIKIDFTPESVFPASAHVEGIGLVPATRAMRRKAASDYALRLALLVAAAAFRCSERVLHVWVREDLETPARHDCYLSVDFDRWRFAKLDLSALGSLPELYHAFAPTMRYEEQILRPVEATFTLSEKRFCPPRRFESVSLSSRRIPPRQADALGTNHVSGLSIDEGIQRTLMANVIMSRLSESESTEESVRTIMEVAGDDPDPSVRSAAERTVKKLIAGAIPEEAEAIGEEFAAGDELTRLTERAQELIMQRKPAEAEELLSPVVEALDRAGTYDDSATIEYRFFANYVDRVLYNRVFAAPGIAQLLVPRAYYEAHLLLSIAQLFQGKHEESLRHARRIIELAPIDARSRLHLVQCLEASGDDEGAENELKRLLEMAHDAEGIGYAYYRMASFMWKRGAILAAQACYACAMQYLPASLPVITMEMTALVVQNPGSLHEDLTKEQVISLLEENDIPVAPSQKVSEVLMDCARASLDAEVFPVAKSFARVMAGLWRDDIMTGLIRSIEDEPEL